MVIFNQNNYPKVYLGNSGLTIAQDGCLECSITHYYNWLNKTNITPDAMVKKLQFDSHGEFLWGSLANIGLKLVIEVDHRSDIIMQSALKDPIEGCIINVHNKGHWMLALSFSGGDYTTADSYTGKVASINKNYSGDISGFAIITKI